MENDLLITKVTPLVVSHVAFGAKGLATAFDGALEWSLVDVDPHMNTEILFFAKGFPTAWECTFERLGPVVEVHVCVEPGLAGESLPAASLRARVADSILFALVH